MHEFFQSLQSCSVCSGRSGCKPLDYPRPDCVRICRIRVWKEHTICVNTKRSPYRSAPCDVGLSSAFYELCIMLDIRQLVLLPLTIPIPIGYDTDVVVR
jgi:hypothetical protein